MKQKNCHQTPLKRRICEKLSKLISTNGQKHFFKLQKKPTLHHNISGSENYWLKKAWKKNLIFFENLKEFFHANEDFKGPCEDTFLKKHILPEWHGQNWGNFCHTG